MKWMYRCANDSLGYCSGEPEWDGEIQHVEVKNAKGDRVEETVKVPIGSPCKRDWRKCKGYRTFEQVVKLEAASV